VLWIWTLLRPYNQSVASEKVVTSVDLWMIILWTACVSRRWEWFKAMGVVLKMNHPVLLKTTPLQALMVPKWAPKAKASEVGLIIILNEVIDHDDLAWWAGFADLQYISGHNFLHVFHSYICYLYNRLWILLSVCVQLSK